MLRHGRSERYGFLRPLLLALPAVSGVGAALDASALAPPLLAELNQDHKQRKPGGKRSGGGWGSGGHFSAGTSMQDEAEPRSSSGGSGYRSGDEGGIDDADSADGRGSEQSGSTGSEGGGNDSATALVNELMLGFDTLALVIGCLCSASPQLAAQIAPSLAAELRQRRDAYVSRVSGC